VSSVAGYSINHGVSITVMFILRRVLHIVRNDKSLYYQDATCLKYLYGMFTYVEIN